ncbi:MAG: STAS domain-containing protein [Zoogloeaceae bacterium]|jgi:anti-sigma B factor antagonist|nr:STAS domain-containing protein [Zoogloeaceae bacterium]
MQIDKHREENRETLTLTGRLDTISAPLLLAALEEDAAGITEIIFELAGLEYVSSAGLRVFLIVHKKMAGYGGKMVLRQVTAEVMDILNMTGFSQFLAIEKPDAA